MKERVEIQFNRITDSIHRLTKGTLLEQVQIFPKPCAEEDRVAFSVSAPAGPPPFQCYAGILLDAVESWTDESLDQRLFASAEISTRCLLNRPAGLEQVLEPEDDALTEDPPPAGLSFSLTNTWTAPHRVDCPQCKFFREEIQLLLARLRRTTRQGKSFCRTYSDDNRDRYLDSLQRHIRVMDSLQEVQRSFGAHLNSEVHCRDL